MAKRAHGTVAGRKKISIQFKAITNVLNLNGCLINILTL